ncbi:CobW family GTP-binding protein [Goodfellowiella coeruleoviolacea]|uniref:GTPase, G3E family n=1 Tax=Goodfellowiella coeruleoviolacea TaxID=334858 RepID=A0AAE3GJB8_9PSEU|nr:GTP-binding protein [Goodfellowiella coeruleoviolacea]MCP2168462.1 GTPase, G3E family [Goodfellowiella coeruleoviolacea]
MSRESAPSGDRVPVILVAGYLGSGKTTLLNHLLRSSGDTRIGVIVNDFGRINIDALAVAGQVDTALAFGNGCLCCVADADGLDTALARLTQPSAGIDAVVIEASGIAEPRTLVRMVLSSEVPRVDYGGLVEVVDAAEFEASRARHPELDQHLRFADLVVLNKTDRVEADTTDRLVQLVAELSQGTPVLPTAHGRINPELLFDRRTRPARRTEARQLSLDDLLREYHEQHDGHLHDAYQSVEFSTARPVNPRRLMEFIRARPGGLYRAKGFVHFGLPGHDDKFTVHVVGGYVRFTRSRWQRQEPRATSLVLIGTDLDRGNLLSALESCVDAEPDTADENGILHVLRHTDDQGVV